MRFLLVEDHPRFGASLVEALSADGYTVDWVRSLEEARAALHLAAYSLLLLDLGLPDGDGLDFLKTVRREDLETPVIVLTARGGLNDRIDGLDGGADDYLVKPFAMRELCSRCRVLLRRPRQLVPESLSLGNLVFNFETSELRIAGQAISAARREIQLLRALLRRQSRVATRDYLENELYAFDAEMSQNALEASVSRLRALCLDNGASVEIRTIRGVGYCLQLKPEREA